MEQFRTAAVFSDNMVLQREKNIHVFGCGIDGKTVEVALAGSRAKAIVKDGKWEAVLPAMKAGVDYCMDITCEEQNIHFKI